MNALFRTDVSDVVRLFADIEGRIDLRGPRGLGKTIAAMMREDVRRQFAMGGIPAWPALSPRTIAAKRAAGYPRLTRRGTIPTSMMQRGAFGPENILMRTGALLQSWTRSPDQDPDAIEEITQGAVATGTKLYYAAAHQTGQPERNLPARPVRITPQLERNVRQLIERALGGSN